MTEQETQAARTGLDFTFNVGDRFKGALPEAKARGYEPETLAYNLFVTGYISALKRHYPNGIWCDDDGIILE